MRNFTVYNSSAGSGKTFTLVRDYLILVMQNPERFASILAVTFTNKAANEMKQRVIRALTNLNQPHEKWSQESKVLAAYIQEQLGCDQSAVCKNASYITHLILHNYSDFAVSTIDSFMQRVIRTFSIDLNLPHDYQIELDNKSLLVKAVDRLIDKIGVDPELTKLLVRFAENKAEEDKSWQIDRDIKNIAKSLFDEEGMELRDALKDVDYYKFTEADKALRKWISGFESNMSAIGQAALNLIDQAGLTESDFYHRKSGIYGFFAKLTKKNFKEAQNPNSYINITLHEDKWSSASASRAAAEAIRAIKASLTDLYNKGISLLSDQGPKYFLYQLLSAQLIPTAVLNEVRKMLLLIQEEDRLLPIAEFNHIVARITFDQPVPFIYERIGSKFRNFMIDEFQDTSVLQWQNILPLIDNSLAYGQFNLVVGDGKQAIYRWRNGKVEQFASLPKLLTYNSDLDREREQALERNYYRSELSKNFRSHRTIVEFNNTFFSFTANAYRGVLGSIYDTVEQSFREDKSDGLVQIEFFDAKSKEQWVARQHERVLEIIVHLSESNYAFRNLAILCRENEECLKLAKYLLSQGIPVISSDSLSIGSSPRVRLVMAFMRFIINPSDTLAAIEAADLLLVNCLLPASEETEGFDQILDNILIQHQESRSRKVDVEKFCSWLSTKGYALMLNHFQELNAYEIVFGLIRLFGWQHKADIYLQFLLEEFHKKLINNTLHTDTLMDWWDTKGYETSVVFPDTIDAVQIMTIHKSKGLEFPVVIYPFANTEVKLRNESAWFQVEDEMLKDIPAAYLPLSGLGNTELCHFMENEINKTLLDTVNLAYVAFTRAEQRLYVLTEAKPEKATENMSIAGFIWNFLSAKAPDLQCKAGETYTLGREFEIPKPSVTAETDEIFCQEGEMDVDNVETRIVIASRAPEAWVEDADDSARRFGRIIHTIMARIRKLSEALSEAEKLYAAGEIPPDDFEEIRKKLIKLAGEEKLRTIFEQQGDVLTECELLKTDGKLFRPDRMVIVDTESCLLYEFKTGIHEQAHEMQIRNYIQILKSAGYTRVKGYLVYLSDQPQVIECN